MLCPVGIDTGARADRQ